MSVPQLTLLRDAAAAGVIAKLLKRCTRFEVTVAWATENSVLQHMRNSQAKLGKMIIGTHFYQTDPNVLESFKNALNVRYMPPTGKLFHPKIYLFHAEGFFAAIVGSHNLTAAAFGGTNIETSLYFQSTDKDPVAKALSQLVADYWKNSLRIDEAFVRAYRAQYDAKKAARDALQKFVAFSLPDVGAKVSPLDLSWDNFVEGVLDDKWQSVEERLETLEGAAKLFAERGSFSAMAKDERKAIAGTYARNEKRFADLEWPWFGAMSGQGDFKNLVNNSPRHLSLALDEIPDSGAVSEDQYGAFVRYFNKAFENKSHKGKIPSASRLLAMKRPDVFICVNDANKRGICSALGVAYSTLKFENYWERIVIPIQSSPYWLAPRPRAKQARRIWDNRAALLDSIYYVPKKPGK